MKIIHRVTFNTKKHKKAKNMLLKCGIKLKEVPEVNICTFEVSEDDSLWPEVAEIIKTKDLNAIITRTEFTKKEILSADWVKVQPKCIKGYPMPDDDWRWKEVSFDLEKICPTCGMGRKQIAPIRLKGEPKIGKSSFMSIFWIFELFALPEVIVAMRNAGITGFEELLPIHYKSLEEIKTVKQLRFTHELEGYIVDDNLKKTFPECGHNRYMGLSKGMYKYEKKVFKGMPDFVKSREWFGARLQATQLLLASSKFVELYYKNKWKGLSFSPVELV